MFGRKSNRRRTESRLAKLRLPKAALGWLARARTIGLSALAVLALVAFGAGARALLDQPVRQLVVEGTFQRVTSLQVEEAVAPDLGRGFLSLDLPELREHVRRLDWVDQVNVGRAWPDTLIVRVTEHRAAARWGDTGLLNVRGELFTDRAQHGYPELPSLSGPSGSEHEVARRYLAARGRLAEADLALESLRMDERGAWTLVLGGGQEIRLGRRDVDERLDRFFEVVAPVLTSELGRVDYVDLRYTNGFAVGWRATNAKELTAQVRGNERG
ncbi:MAG TPA: cell division protein FtsQ/DivIB [Gammaproteobacteria bacterium]|nr:cell division protein FtsQ/DivIB [Gammaproteobacteria bacterium]